MRQRERNWDRATNEGNEGYNPHRARREADEWAAEVSRIEALAAKPISELTAEESDDRISMLLREIERRDLTDAEQAEYDALKQRKAALRGEG